MESNVRGAWNRRDVRQFGYHPAPPCRTARARLWTTIWAPAGLAELPSPLRHPVAATVWSVRALFGIVSLIVLLAILAAIPLVNFLVLGYLLEAEGRLARTGKLRGAIPLLSIAPRLGSDRLVRLAVGLAAAAAGECGGGCPID